MASFQEGEGNSHVEIYDNCNMVDQVVQLDNIEENTKKDKLEDAGVVVRLGGEFKLNLGMVVHSEIEAYNLYNDYGYKKGFSIRRDQIRYIAGTNVVRERTYVCAKEGFADSSPSKVKKFDRLETRTGCMARVVFKVENDMWEIIKFYDDHTHEFVLPEQKHLLRSARKIQNTTKDVIHSLYSVGVGPTKAHNFIAKGVGGFHNVCGTKRDFHNVVNQNKLNLIEAGDAKSLINHLKHRQAVDPLFFYSMQLDDQSWLTNIFWRDGISKLDYDSFGDVVIFYTTFRTNKYNMICAPFVGVNHHWQNTLFGCVFLLDETTFSFVWLFECFLEAMGKRHPNVIFTDQDPAMAGAIKKVFSDACHRLCEWHIHKNAAQNIPHLYGKSEFRKLFYKCFRGCTTEEEFECAWKEMVVQWDVSENSWLCRLYNSRKKWCPVFSNDFFSANMISTQRSESANNFFQRMSRKTLSLTEFVDHYEVNAEKMREAENNEDFRCVYGRPRVRIPSGILIHAADVYTTKMYGKFQEEFDRGVATKIIEHVQDGGIDCYKVTMKDSSKVRIVRFDPCTLTIDRSCKKFDTLGLVCSHILRVLNVSNHDSEIPEKYISKRWTKGVKDLGIGSHCKASHKSDVKESKTITFSRLMHKTSRVINAACFDEKSAEIFEEMLEEAYEKIKKYKENVGDSGADISKGQIPTSLGKQKVFDPSNARTKGMTKK